MGQQTYQIGRCARTEPVIVDAALAESIEQTERIVYIRQPVAEMIPVILQFQPLTHLLCRTTVIRSHACYRLRKITVQLLLCYSAKRLVVHAHADVIGLVETAENTHLRELGHTRQKHELKVTVGSLEYRIETLQYVPVAVFQRGVYIEHIQYRLVVLINQHYGTAAALFVGGTEHFCKAIAQAKFLLTARKTILTLPFGNIEPQFILQLTGIGIIPSVEIHMKYRIDIPVLLQELHGQTAEQLLTSLIIVLQRRDQQALPETAGTAQETDTALVGQPVD